MKKIVFALAVLAAAASHASTEGYFMLSVFSPGQLPSPVYSIYGARLSAVYGECHELYGIDLGAAGYVRERMYGLQANVAWSGVGTDFCGFQAALLDMVDGYSAGLQAGLVDISDDNYGGQIGAVDIAGDLYGCQIGLACFAGDVRGCQIGLFNKASRLYGCQIGLANVVTSRKWSFWPFINVGW